ncbi:PR domain zinc finger protein 5-like [Rhynchophorus ferrugineus]|uniref:PR domain zinc finger protein 5-like n=1 Tax=Rhynchophorus ferrugineus TaxID=354439 RepID=UPI003FCED38C
MAGLFCLKEFGLLFLLQGATYECNVCQKSYNKYHSFYMHRKFYCGIAPKFACPYDGCQYKSQLKTNLKRHQNTFHRKPTFTFSCEKCNKGYSRLESLYMHRRYTCQKVKQGGYRFACFVEGCSYMTNLRFNFNRHIAGHKNRGESTPWKL